MLDRAIAGALRGPKPEPKRRTFVRPESYPVIQSDPRTLDLAESVWRPEPFAFRLAAPPEAYTASD